MIIKKFQAKTENEAIEAAKKELGANVVVMNVRQVKKKGLFAFLKPTLIEVTVALEEETERKEVNSVDAKNITEALGKIAPIIEKAEREKEQHSQAGIAPVREKEVEVKEAKETKEAKDSSIEEKLDNLQNLIEGKLQKGEDETEKEAAKPKEEDSEFKLFLDLLKKTMEDNEVDDEYVSSILEEASRSTKPGTPMDVCLAGIYQKMVLKFGKAETITPSEHGPKTVFFIGPTGVGKTTTIAKIASKFCVEQKKKIALLTADTYRIAAAEQLRTYANILEVPFRIIYTVEEMEAALKDFKDYDYVFVDTAGHSHQNVEQKNLMAGFIHSVDGLVEKEVYLVVSATTKYRDLKSIADAYSEMTDYKLIFTKLDETTALGNILNLKLYTNASLSYVTCGQNVPDDIEDFNAQRTVKNLMGGRR